MIKEITEREDKWEKFVLHDSVIAVIASPKVGDKFEPEKYNYANQKLNELNEYIFTKGKDVIQDIIASAVEAERARISDEIIKAIGASKLGILKNKTTLEVLKDILSIINPSKK